MQPRITETEGATVVEAIFDGRRARAVFTDRHGPTGGVLDGTNLSRIAGDDAAAVLRARDWAANLVGLGAGDVVWGRQVHGAQVAAVDRDACERHRLASGAGAVIPDTDALVTVDAHIGVGVLAADCVPVFLAGPDAIGVVHSGWRGLVAGVVENGVRELCAVSARLRSGAPVPYGSDAARSVIAVVGPSIGVCCYEVGDDVVESIRVGFTAGDVVSEAPGRRAHVDLRRGAAIALERAGVTSITPLFPCTRCSDRYWSHRRGEPGRQALVARVEHPVSMRGTDR